ncbi:MAG: response regulator [Endomicrobiales bacterium]|nr:response regulator [Endomicrobiales bacterium]
MLPKKILVIDDEYDILRVIEEMLKKEGYTVITATNGQDGYKKFQQERPDLVISDIMMPIMDGYQVCEKIKGNPDTKDIPVIILTVKSMGEDVDKALELKADWYITKPFDSKYLLKRVKDFIGKGKPY